MILSQLLHVAINGEETLSRFRVIEEDGDIRIQ